MPEAKVRKYAVTLGRRVKKVLSTITLVIEATDRKKAAFLAEKSINSGDAVSKNNRSWSIQKIEMLMDDNKDSNDGE